MFTKRAEHNELELFLDAVLVLADRDLKVVRALRAAFFGPLLPRGGMARAVPGAFFTLLPMNDDELRDAIVKPAEGTGRAVEGELVDSLVNDVRGGLQTNRNSAVIHFIARWSAPERSSRR